MVSEVRQHFNQKFTEPKYQKFLNYLAEAYDHKPNFRIAETPVFVPNDLRLRLREACDQITEVFCQPNFKEITKNAILQPEHPVPKEDYHTRFIQVDFGICKDENGELTPKLIEVQGFPSLYFFQDLLAKAYRKFFEIPENFKNYPGELTSETYLELLRQVIVGDNDPENVVLLEIEPEKQVTKIDFLGAAHHLGIKVLCISDLIKEGEDLYYENPDGRKVHIHKIYNRVIFDELQLKDDLKRQFYFKDEVNVEWVGHPNWFFRISKYTLPLLESKYVPRSFYLDQLDSYPDNLENYVLKPLYSFAGSGVRLNVNRNDLDQIDNPENFIIQERVNYGPFIATPTGPAKCEIRMMTIWQPGQPKAEIVNNLVRISKGEMIGVRYNKDKDWVGASIGMLEFDE